MMTSENLDLWWDNWRKLKKLKDVDDYNEECDTLELMSDDDLWKKVEKLEDKMEYNKECDTCGIPRILHEGVCIRSEKVMMESLMEIWWLFAL